jgi:ABC-type multidrug transport system fused ATPase/permease subunit
MKDFFYKANTIFDRKEKFKLFFYLILSIFTPVIEAIGVGSLAALIMLFFDKLNPGKNIYLEKIGLDIENIIFFSSIQNILFLVIIIFLFRGVYLFFFHYYETKLRNILVAKKSKLIYKKFMNFSYLEMKNSSKSEVFNSTVLETARVIDYIFGIITISREIILIFILFGSLFILNSLYTIILSSFLIVFSLIFLFFYNKKLYSVGEELINLQKELLNLINESVSSFKIISLLNKKKFFFKNFFLATDTRKDNLFYQQFIKKLPKVIFETLIIILISFIIIIFYSDDSISETLSFLAILGLISSRILPSFTTLNVLYSTIKFNQASLNNYYEKFFYKKIIINKYNKKNLLESIEDVNSINIKNLKFSYNKIKILEAVNLDIHKSKIFGIFGRSGSGKSTLIDIIAGLIDPDEGQIFYNNDKEIHENIYSWHSSLGYVSHDALLLNDSIKNNICLGVDEDKIDYGKMENIIDLIGMNKFYNDYNNNIDCKIGEGGSRISGGQKQRISIARTLYFNPKIIIFDEATSSLDNEAEQQILDLIVKLKKEHIIIIISHNEKIKNICDNFIDLDKK